MVKEWILSRSRKGKDVWSHHFYLTWYEGLSRYSSRGNEIEGIIGWKGRNKKTNFLCRWQDYLWRKSKRFYKKASRTNGEIKKIAGYMFNTQESIVFLYTRNELESEIKTLFAIVSKVRNV